MNRVVLVVVKGKDFGRSIVVNVGHCVMIGRSESMVGATGMITQHSASKLTDEDERQVLRHLKIRATPKNHGARSLLTSFERDMDVGLRDDSVSQRHAMVFCDEAGASLLDMASTNGTFLNGKRTPSAELQLGDLIRIGETRIEVRG
jgi:FHA domain